MARIRVGLAIAAALLAASASAEIYRWRDAQGVEHFTTDLHQVPAQHRAAAEAGASAASGGSYNAGGGDGEATSTTPTPAPDDAPAAGFAPTSRVLRRDAITKPPNDTGEAAGGLDETWWRERSAESLNRIADLERRIQACEGMDPPSAGRHIREHDHDRKIAALNDCAIAQDQLEVANRQRENLEEDARRLGVPPGWLR